MQIGLISCVKTKRNTPSKARDLYISQLFKSQLAYALKHCQKVYILSAKYGLVDLDTVIAPYEKTLNTMDIGDRDRWAYRVWQQLKLKLVPGDNVVFLAGQRYREGLLPMLQRNGYSYSVPFEGLKMGQLLSALKKI